VKISRLSVHRIRLSAIEVEIFIDLNHGLIIIYQLYPKNQPDNC